MLRTPTARTWRDSVIPGLHEQAWLKDVQSRFLAVNAAFADACGVTAEEMVGETETPFFASCRVERFRDDDRRAIAWGRVILVAEVTPDARFLTFKAPVLDENGRVAGTVGIALPDVQRAKAISRGWLDLFPERLSAGPALTPTWLMRVRRELEAAFSRPVSVAALASSVGRNVNYVTSAFRRTYGVPPVEYAHRRRVEWTARVLAASELPLSRIAQEAGFTDQSHMTRVFSRYFGITPGAYREAMRRGTPLNGLRSSEPRQRCGEAVSFKT